MSPLRLIENENENHFHLVSLKSQFSAVNNFLEIFRENAGDLFTLLARGLQAQLRRVQVSILCQKISDDQAATLGQQTFTTIENLRASVGEGKPPIGFLLQEARDRAREFPGHE